MTEPDHATFAASAAAAVSEYVTLYEQALALACAVDADAGDLRRLQARAFSVAADIAALHVLCEPASDRDRQLSAEVLRPIGDTLILLVALRDLGELAAAPMADVDVLLGDLDRLLAGVQ